MEGCNKCKDAFATEIVRKAIQEVESEVSKKINAIWLETSGCFGEVISLLNADNPDVPYMLQQIVNIKYFGTIMGDDDGQAYKQILDILNTEYIFIVSGAIPTRSNGAYATVATYNGRKITAMEAVKNISKNAKYIVNIGTCACFGGPTAAKPNLSEAVSVSELLGRADIIKIPGCPANPVWIMGIIGYLTTNGVPPLDKLGRPLAYFSETIHEKCERRRFFDAGIFAQTFGEKECMFMLGCRGPVTYAYCPVSRWNDSENWPIGDNTTCIGCVGPGFPDNMEPFVKYGGGQGV